MSLVLLSAVVVGLVSTCTRVSATAETAVPLSLRGLPRSLYSAYQSAADGKFICRDNSKSILFTSVNDDFCDCPDGSDEPGTPACSNGRFYCLNKGYRGKYIPSMYVNDGVCDCCDGSDELGARATVSGGARCENTCDADGATWRLTQAENIRRTEEGARRRLEYSTEGTEAARARRGRIAELTSKVALATAEREIAEGLVATEEEKERVAASGGGGASSSGSTSSYETMASQSLGLASLDAAGLLKLLLEHTKNTATSDKLIELIKSHIAAGILSLGVDKTFEPVWVDAPAAAASATSADGPHIPKSAAGDAARTRFTTAKADEGKLKGELSTLKEEDETDFGPDAAFYKLRNNCYDLKVNQYTYHVCPFGRATQDGTHLGTYSGWKKSSSATANSKDAGVMQFTGGSTCWNGPARSLAVTFECGMEDKVFAIDEPEKCTYAARMTTPAACDARTARDLKLELEEDDQGGNGEKTGRDEL